MNNTTTEEILDPRLAKLDYQIEEAAAVMEYKKCQRLQAKRDRLAAKLARKAQKRKRSEKGRAAHSNGSHAKGAKQMRVPEDAGGDWKDVRTSTARLLPYLALRRDGVMQSDERRFNIALAIDDVNYIGSRKDEQEDVRTVFSDWLNGLDSNTRVQLSMVTRRQRTDELMDSLMIDPVSGDDYGNMLRRELNSWCEAKATSSSRSMKRTLSAVISIEADSIDRAMPTLARESDRLIRMLRDLQSDAHRMTGDERLEDIRRYTRPDDQRGTVRFDMLEGSYGTRTSDLLAPSIIEHLATSRTDSRMIVGTRWCKSYTMRLDGWGQSIRDSFLSDLAGLPYDTAISWHIEPWSEAAAANAVERKVFSIQEENQKYMINNSQPERGYFVDETNLPVGMKDATREARGLRDDVLGDAHERLFSVVISILVMARDETELDAADEDINAVFGAHRCPNPDSWAALSEQGYTTALPLGICQLPYERTLTTRPLVHMMPFAAAELFDRSGFLMGINLATRNFIQYDPALREHSNSFVLAEPRSGKSFNVKLTRILQSRLRHPDDDVIIIDPEREYADLTTNLDGQVINISETSNDHINPCDITEMYAAETRDSKANPIPSKVSFLTSMVKMMARTVTETELALFDQMATMAYRAWDEAPVERNTPTLQTIYDLVESASAGPDDARRLCTLLSRFVSGSQSFFNHRTNVEIESHLVDFVLADLSQELKPLAMFIVLDYIWTRVTANRKSGRRTWLIIDELQLLMDDERAMEKLNTFFSRGGKWDLYNCAIAQNATRMLDVPATRYMLQNTPFLTLMGQTADSAHELADLLGLSESQERALRTSQPGEGLYVLKNQIMQFDFRITPDECPQIYRVLTTRANDIKLFKASTTRKVGQEMKINGPTREIVQADGSYVKETQGTAVEFTAEELRILIDGGMGDVVQRALERAAAVDAIAVNEGPVRAIEAPRAHGTMRDHRRPEDVAPFEAKLEEAAGEEVEPEQSAAQDLDRDEGDGASASILQEVAEQADGQLEEPVDDRTEGPSEPESAITEDADPDHAETDGPSLLEQAADLAMAGVEDGGVTRAVEESARLRMERQHQRVRLARTIETPSDLDDADTALEEAPAADREVAVEEPDGARMTEPLEPGPGAEDDEAPFSETIEIPMEEAIRIEFALAAREKREPGTNLDAANAKWISDRLDLDMPSFLDVASHASEWARDELGCSLEEAYGEGLVELDRHAAELRILIERAAESGIAVIPARLNQA
ncbi:MAG: hypothetical protein SOU51_01100 [Collinsella sp.]|nr:hypothetical protein [Collinsella sp.]